MTNLPKDVTEYIDAIPTQHRALLDRVQRLILHAHPHVDTSLSYDMPTYRLNGRRLHLGVWRHGISIYGWRKDNDGGFVARYPKLKTSTGTIRLKPDEAASISDDELLGLLAPALGADAGTSRTTK